jgi:hypothetical protein
MAMVDDPSDEARDEWIARLLRPESGRSRRGPAPKAGFSTGKRGRPPDGFAKAYKYWNQYWHLRLAQGMSPWHAKEEVARLNGRTVEHISACVKRLEETDPRELWEEPDGTEDAF